MLLIQYETHNHLFELLRNNPATGYAEKTAFHPAAVESIFPDDGALESLFNLCREVPNAWHTVPNPKPPRREVFGRMVL